MGWNTHYTIGSDEQEKTFTSLALPALKMLCRKDRVVGCKRLRMTQQGLVEGNRLQVTPSDTSFSDRRVRNKSQGPRCFERRLFLLLLLSLVSTWELFCSCL